MRITNRSRVELLRVNFNTWQVSSSLSAWQRRRCWRTRPRQRPAHANALALAHASIENVSYKKIQMEILFKFLKWYQVSVCNILQMYVCIYLCMCCWIVKCCANQLLHLVACCCCFCCNLQFFIGQLQHWLRIDCLAFPCLKYSSCLKYARVYVYGYVCVCVCVSHCSS